MLFLTLTIPNWSGRFGSAGTREIQPYSAGHVATPGQRIRVFPNGTLGLRMVGKEGAGWYTAMVCNSSQHCLYQKKFQLCVHGHLVRGLVGDCVTFDLNCLQSAGYIHVIWKTDNQDKTGSESPCDLLQKSPRVPQRQLEPLPHAMWG